MYQFTSTLYLSSQQIQFYTTGYSSTHQENLYAKYVPTLYHRSPSTPPIIQGNDLVDKQAKTLLSLEPTSFKMPLTNFKPSINKYILDQWQASWNNIIGNNFLEIKPTTGEHQSVVRNIRKEEVILARLHLGNTRVTHSYLLQGEEQPECVDCDAPFTVGHFLLECGVFAQVRNNCFHVENMKQLFQAIHIDSIMPFLRQINLFNKI